MGSIFELAGAYKQLYSLLTDADESEEDIIEDSMDAIVGEIEVKGNNYLMLCDKFDMEIDACDKQIAYWTNEKRIRENAVKRLKERLSMFLSMIGKKEIDCGGRKIKLVGNGGKVPLKYFDELKSDIQQKDVDLTKIPNKYKKTVVTETLDTDKIREDLDKGLNLSFVEYGERGSHIRFS